MAFAFWPPLAQTPRVLVNMQSRSFYFKRKKKHIDPEEHEHRKKGLNQTQRDLKSNPLPRNRKVVLLCMFYTRSGFTKTSSGGLLHAIGVHSSNGKMISWMLLFKAWWGLRRCQTCSYGNCKFRVAVWPSCVYVMGSWLLTAVHEVLVRTNAKNGSTSIIHIYECFRGELAREWEGWNFWVYLC